MYHPFLSIWSYKTTLTSFLSSAPKTSQRPRTRRPRPKHKSTPSPATSQSKLGKYVVPDACGTPWDMIFGCSLTHQLIAPGTLQCEGLSNKSSG